MIETARSRGLVFAMGADCTARSLKRARVDLHDDAAIVHLPDFAAPRLRLRLEADDGAFRAMLAGKEWSSPK